jgi:hypothetical protein
MTDPIRMHAGASQAQEEAPAGRWERQEPPVSSDPFVLSLVEIGGTLIEVWRYVKNGGEGSA